MAQVTEIKPEMTMSQELNDVRKKRKIRSNGDSFDSSNTDFISHPFIQPKHPMEIMREMEINARFKQLIDPLPGTFFLNNPTPYNVGYNVQPMGMPVQISGPYLGAQMSPPIQLPYSYMNSQIAMTQPVPMMTIPSSYSSNQEPFQVTLNRILNPPKEFFPVPTIESKPVDNRPPIEGHGPYAYVKCKNPNCIVSGRYDLGWYCSEKCKKN